MMNTTLAQLRDLKLAGRVAAIEEQVSAGTGSALCFEERLALMGDREVHHRSDKRRAGLLSKRSANPPLHRRRQRVETLPFMRTLVR